MSLIFSCNSLADKHSDADDDDDEFFEISAFIVCVCSVSCKFVSGLILWFMDNLWFYDSRAE